MARHLDDCPPRAHADLQRLAGALDRDVPAKLLDRNLLLATWNTTHYDQIAWFEDLKGSRPLTLQYVQGGSFDFCEDAMASRGLAPRDLSWCLSDHPPLWVEFAMFNPP